MFNRISSKLRNRSSNGNVQKDKSFAYGKMQKDDLASQAEVTNNESGNQVHSFWKDEEEEKGEARSSFAEVMFPVDDKVNQSRSYSDSYGDREGSVSGDSFSLDEHTKRSLPGSSSLQEQDFNIGPAILPEYDDAEEDFLREYEEYFDHLSVDAIRKEQYPKLELQRLVYLDYANCGLYSSYQIEEYRRVLMEEGPCLVSAETGSYLSNHVADAQDYILRLFNTEFEGGSYTIIFTTGQATSFRLMGEAYPFQRNTPLLICQDNHEVIQNLIGPAVGRGAKAVLAPIGESDLSLRASELRKLFGRQGRQRSAGSGGLFVFPAQSCASGVLHSMNWVVEAQQYGWQVMVDTSTYLPTGRLDLTLYQPDFVLGSISHLLGYPSGMSFILVRKDVFRVQRNGDQRVKFVPVVTSSSNQERDCVFVNDDNVLNSSSFAAVTSGLVHLENVGYEAIEKRVRSLSAWLLQTLLSLKHKGDPGSPLTRVHGPLSTRNRGNIIAFSVLDSTGNEFPSRLVQILAEKNSIILGAGQLCSPGLINLLRKAPERAKDITVFEQRSRSSSETGLMRVSLGPMTTFRDVYRLAQFLSRFRDEDYLSSEAMDYFEDKSAERLQR